MKFRYILLSCVLSLLAYLLIFAFWVKKPMTYSHLDSLVRTKYSRLESIKDENKVVILAGSNGRYSHSAKVFERELKMKSVNLSIAASLSIEYQLDKMRGLLKRGDIVLLPLEFSNYDSSETHYLKAAEGIYNLTYNKPEFFNMSLKKQFYSFASANLDMIVEDLVERIMQMRHMSRRPDNQNEYGDQVGHNFESGEPYRAYIKSQARKDCDSFVLNENSHSCAKLKEFLLWAKANGVKVVGSLPTTPIGWKLSADYVAAVKDFYIKNGQYFLDTPNNC